MPINVYIISEPSLIDFIMNNDIEGFKDYLNETKEKRRFYSVCELESFDTEVEALAFSDSIGYGADEHVVPERFPLWSCKLGDLSFINTIGSN